MNVILSRNFIFNVITLIITYIVFMSYSNMILFYVHHKIILYTIIILGFYIFPNILLFLYNIIEVIFFFIIEFAMPRYTANKVIQKIEYLNEKYGVIKNEIFPKYIYQKYVTEDINNHFWKINLLFILFINHLPISLMIFFSLILVLIMFYEYLLEVKYYYHQQF